MASEHGTYELARLLSLLSFAAAAILSARASALLATAYDVQKLPEPRIRSYRPQQSAERRALHERQVW